jgi:CHAT domain-containing protein
LRDTGRLDEARSEAEAAVAVIESVRSRLGSPDLRASFLGSRQEAFEIHIDVLMRLDAARPGQGFDRMALEASERARARTLLDFLRTSGSEARNAVAPDLLARRRDLERRLALKADRRQGLLGSGREAAGVKALEVEIEQLAAELDLVEAEIRKQDPRYAGLVQGQFAGATEIQALLDPGTLLLEYSLGRDRSYLWAVGADSLRAFVLPGREEIEREARALHEALSRPPAPGEDRTGLGASLGRMLLGPVAGELRDRRLAIVADGALHYIPFGVLPTPGEEAEPLLRRHETIDLPSASFLSAARRQPGGRAPAPRLAIVLADPVFGPEDSRVRGKTAALRGAPGSSPAQGRLRFSRIEADEIAALAPPGTLAAEIGFAASRDLALSGRLRDYRYVHFATHGVFDTARPELSGLVLSRIDEKGRPREGFVGLRDIYNLELGAELVVLSGCQTALGREIRGEGLLGLTRGFLYAGAPRVVASLWQVDDRATAELMSRFYRGLWTDGLPPAAALRKARLSLAAERRFRDPFYWGAFVLQGDWR